MNANTEPMVVMNDLRRRVAPLEAELNAAVAQVLMSGRYILGAACTEFEAAFAQYCGTQHCLGVANGTDALELALRALEISSGERVACVANAGMYAATAIIAVGAMPVFIDIDPETLTMSPSALDAAGPVDAVIVTHTYGQMADMPAILKAAHGVPVIEDCAQAHGALLEGKRAGAWGTLGCFSFYPTKNLGALGDGGAITTSDPEIAETVRRLRQYGWSSRYHAELPGGRNSRLDEIQAAMLLIMLPKLDGWNASRRALVGRYAAATANRGVRLPRHPESPAYVGHLCVLRHSQRDRFRAALEARGVATDLHYPLPDYRQPAVIAAIGTGRPLPETERAVGEILSIPCFPELSEREAERVTEALVAASEAVSG